jgi:hypothetical protein
VSLLDYNVLTLQILCSFGLTQFPAYPPNPEAKNNPTNIETKEKNGKKKALKNATVIKVGTKIREIFQRLTGKICTVSLLEASPFPCFKVYRIFISPRSSVISHPFIT